GQLRNLQIGQLPLPVSQLRRGVRTALPAGLPAGEVGILQRQAGERRLLSADQLAVGLADLAGQQRQRPSVGGNVVHGQEKLVLGVRRAQQQAPQERAAGKVERRGDL